VLARAGRFWFRINWSLLRCLASREVVTGLFAKFKCGRLIAQGRGFGAAPLRRTGFECRHQYAVYFVTQVTTHGAGRHFPFVTPVTKFCVGRHIFGRVT
jgi:hypothetical protein